MSQPNTFSAERAFSSDARLALAVLNEARYPILRRMFGVSRDQANILTLILVLSAADATYEVVRRLIRHPWPLDGPDTVIAAFAVREAGFSLAGPKVRQGQLFGILIVGAGVGRLIVPGARRALHGLHVAEQRVGQQRMRIYGTAQRALSRPRARASSSASARDETPSFR
jgi:hypothetical protein